MQTLLHYFLHLIFPLGIAFVFFRSTWRQAYLIMLLTMLVDLDHLFAEPIFQPDRCSIGYHPLHSFYAIIGYTFLLFLSKPYRLIGLGLLLHMVTDFIDCLIMFRECGVCYTNTALYEILQNIP